jgi:hypothetical protein
MNCHDVVPDATGDGQSPRVRRMAEIVAIGTNVCANAARLH